MIEIRKSEDRGKTKLDWLTSYHSFSFNHYYDPTHVRFGPVRVLNDDIIMPGTGFGAHSHDNMEIVTYVLEGTLEHQDSIGTRGIIKAGEVQRMSAGTGIVHSEYNASDKERVHLLQIWFFPNERGLTPSYEQKNFTKNQRKNLLLPAASERKELGGVYLHQDVTMYVSNLEVAHELSYQLQDGRGVYLYLADGKADANNVALSKGDAAKVYKEQSLTIRAAEESEIVLFDVPLGS